MNSELQHLSQHELLSLALDAFQREDSGRALAYLKEAGSREDANAQVLFMLGSEYAQIGMIPEAKAVLLKALHATPELPIARFQLGLLHLTSGDAISARETWQPLLNRTVADASDYLRHFAQGLLDASEDSWDNARSALLQGIALNLDNPALNKNMQGVIERLNAAQATAEVPAVTLAATAAPIPPIAAAPASTSASDVDASHLFISAYQHRGKPH